MGISAADVKQLRDKTGAGMMDCKKALVEADGDFDKAERILKELGKAAAAKRSGRATNEGRVFVHSTDDAVSIVELSCETDFVARNETFVELGNQIARAVIARNLTAADDQIVAAVEAAIGTIKENLSLRRFDVLPLTGDQIVGTYTHGEAARMGGAVILTVGAEHRSSEAAGALAADLAMHAVAFRPAYLSPETVPADYRKEQEEIFLQQARNLGRPEKVLQGIVAGKLNKHLAEICFVEQGFVRDDKKSVAAVVAEAAKAAGGTFSVDNYVVYTVGEDLS